MTENPYESPGTASLTYLPEVVPDACLQCNRPFSRVLKPVRRLQARAKMIVAGGVIASMAISPIVLIVIMVVMSEVANVVGLIPFSFFILAIGTVLVSALPGYFIGVWAMRLPRVVRLNCRGCGWSASYLVIRTGKVISEA